MTSDRKGRPDGYVEPDKAARPQRLRTHLRPEALRQAAERAEAAKTTAAEPARDDPGPGVTKRALEDGVASLKINWEAGAVGYGAPPIGSRFKAGVSGNPAGRPKGSKNKRTNFLGPTLDALLVAEGNREVLFRENGEEEERLPALQAAVRKIHCEARKGKVGMARLLLKATGDAHDKLWAMQQQALENAESYKVRWTEEFERCKNEGRPPPGQLPHPDHVVVDWDAREVRFTGPTTLEGKVRWDEMHATLLSHEEEIESLRAYIETLADPEEKAFWAEQKAESEALCQRIVGLIGRPPGEEN
jgi:hypothetical protein